MSDKELLAQIAQVAGAINKHHFNSSVPQQYSFNNARGGYHGRGRGRGRGALTYTPGPFNRTLTNTSPAPISTPTPTPTPPITPRVSPLPTPAKAIPQPVNSFVRPPAPSRHLSLVNNKATVPTGKTTEVTIPHQGTAYQSKPVLDPKYAYQSGTSLIIKGGNQPSTEPQHQTQHWIQSKGKNVSMMNPESYKKTMEAKLKSIKSSKEKKKKLQEARAKLASDRLKGIVTVGGKQYNKSMDGRKLVMRDASQDSIVINGVAFDIDPRGNKLVRKSITTAKPQAMATSLASTKDMAHQTPKQFSIDGVVYVRTTSGNLVRASLTKKFLLQKRAAQEAKRKRHVVKEATRYCKFYTRFGKCSRGVSCPYKHSRSHLAICKKFLRGNCPNSAISCHLSHTPSPHTTPACLHFQRAACSKDNCLYQHIRINPRAPICRPFATEGWCETGGNCKDRHVWICPDFGTPAGCKKKCGLAHIEDKRNTNELDNDKKRQGDDINIENSKRKRVDSLQNDRPSGRYIDSSSTQGPGQNQGQVNDNVTKKLQHDENFVPFDFEDNDEIPFVDQDENEVMEDFEADQESEEEESEEEEEEEDVEDISSDELDNDLEEVSEYEEDEAVDTSGSEEESDSEINNIHEDELERFYAEQDREYDHY